MSNVNDDIEKYRRGELSPAEMHALEKRALTDSFLADALEGAESLSAEEFAEDVVALNKSIKKGSRSVFTPLRIAAGIVVLIGAGLFLFWPDSDSTMIASKQSSAAGESSKVDSIKQDEVTSAASQTQQQLAQADQQKSDATKSQNNQLRAKELKSSKTVEKQQDRDAREEVRPKETESTVADQLAANDNTSPIVADRMETEKATLNTTKVSGNVTVAEDGLPLPGVNVTVKGTTIGTTTDIYGNYTLDAPANSELVYSFVGMQTSERQVPGNGKLDVKLNEDATQLSEVVITRSALPRPDSDEPLIKMAEPVGGIKAYDKYMEDNLRYPQQALENDVKGRVVVEFSVAIDGSIGDFVVMKSLGYGCDDEVIRLVKEGPQWRPTTEDDKPIISSVRVRMKFDAAKRKKK